MSASFLSSEVFFLGLFLVVCVVMFGDVTEDYGRTGVVRDCEIVIDGKGGTNGELAGCSSISLRFRLGE